MIKLIQDIERTAPGEFTVYSTVINEAGEEKHETFVYTKAGSIYAGYKALITELQQLKDCEVNIETTHNILSREIQSIHEQDSVLARMLQKIIKRNGITVAEVVLKRYKNR